MQKTASTQADSRFAEILILRAHEAQKEGDIVKALSLFDQAVRLVGNDEAIQIADECVVEVPRWLDRADEVFIPRRERYDFAPLY